MRNKIKNNFKGSENFAQKKPTLRLILNKVWRDHSRSCLKPKLLNKTSSNVFFSKITKKDERDDKNDKSSDSYRL